MNKIKIQTTPITNQIIAGTLNKKGNLFLTKEDVTIDALFCVAEYLEALYKKNGNRFLELKGGVNGSEVKHILKIVEVNKK